MADVFSQFETNALLSSKHILFLGDSNIRALYKDLVWLLNSNTLVTHAALRSKLEFSYLGDTLINRSKLHYGRDFEEVRCFKDQNCQITVDFMFISRCYNKHLENLFNDIKRGQKPVPDVVVMNSCVWDLTRDSLYNSISLWNGYWPWPLSEYNIQITVCDGRWGPNGVPEYKDNLVKLMRLMRASLPKECLVIWTTALPPAAHIKGGLLIKQVECMEPLLRFEVMEANSYARAVVANHGFDVLDNHYYIRMQMHRRAKDGIHYMPVPTRFMTNLILTHIALSWDCELPARIKTVLLDKAMEQACKDGRTQSVERVPTTGIFSKINLTSPVAQKTRGLTVTINPNVEGMNRRCNLFPYQTSGYPVQQYQNYHQNNFEYHQHREISLNQGFQSGFRDFSQENCWEPSQGGPSRRIKNKNKRKDPYHNSWYNHRY